MPPRSRSSSRPSGSRERAEVLLVSDAGARTRSPAAGRILLSIGDPAVNVSIFPLVQVIDSPRQQHELRHR
jgi:hypothetical protein